MESRVYRPNRYACTVEEFDRYSVVFTSFDGDGNVIGEFGVLPVGTPWSKQLLCQIVVSETYSSLGLVKDCLRLCKRFDKMGYRLYAHSVPELRRFFELLGFREYGVMDDGYIRWKYNGKKK